MAIRKKVSKKSSKRKAGRAVSKQKIPGWITLLIGMLFGLAIAVFGYVNDWVPKPGKPNEMPIAQSTKSNNNSDVEDNSADLQIKPKKDYDFYTTLQEMEVIVDVKELKQTDSRTPQNLTIQLGAFKKLEDAESLKAQVAFIGQTAYIQAITDKNKTEWHRVRIGPFTSGREADVVRKSLEKNDFDSIIIKEK